MNKILLLVLLALSTSTFAADWLWNRQVQKIGLHTNYQGINYVYQRFSPHITKLIFDRLSWSV
jgi:hypothetical protein